MPDEIKKGWYVDSAPGNSFATFKCGEIKASTGISGYTHITTPPPPPPPDGGPSTAPPDIDDHRATLPPGTRLVPPLTGNIAARATVWFDRESALYGLPTVNDTGTFSLSFWYNPWGEPGSGQENGCNGEGLLFGSPSQPLCPDGDSCQGGYPVMDLNGVATPVPGVEYFDIMDLTNWACRSASEVAIRTPGGDHWQTASWTKQEYQEYRTSPVDEMQGWCHIMMSLSASGSRVYATVWINDTELLTNSDVGAINGTLPFHVRDFTDGTAQQHFWNIGGKPDRLSGFGCCAFIFNPDNPEFPVPYINGPGKDCSGGCQVGPYDDGTGHNALLTPHQLLTRSGMHLVDSSVGSWPGSMGKFCGEGTPHENDCQTGCFTFCGNYQSPKFSCARMVTTGQDCGCAANHTYGNFPPCGGESCGGCAGTCDCTDAFPAGNWCLCCPGTPCGPGGWGHTTTPCPYGSQVPITVEVWCPDASKGVDFRPMDQDGFNGGVTELWIAPGQFVDWSSTAARYRFHTSDDPYDPNQDTGGTDATVWSPIDLGPTGKGIVNGADELISGTGTKPLIYLTGPPAYFNYNRAKNKAKLELFRNSSGGVVGRLIAYFSVPTQFV